MNGHHGCIVVRSSYTKTRAGTDESASPTHPRLSPQQNIVVSKEQHHLAAAKALSPMHITDESDGSPAASTADARTLLQNGPKKRRDSEDRDDNTASTTEQSSVSTTQPQHEQLELDAAYVLHRNKGILLSRLSEAAPQGRLSLVSTHMSLSFQDSPVYIYPPSHVHSCCCFLD